MTVEMSVKPLNLVKYAGDYWVTLLDYTRTRDTAGYSNQASVKSAIRTYVVRTNPDKYIAFRGEVQIKNIMIENKNNDMFRPEDFEGHTRTALIHYSMLEVLNERFAVSKAYKKEFDKFMKKSAEYMREISKEQEEAAPATNETVTVSVGDSVVFETRSSMLRQLRNELNRIDKEMEMQAKNREKILQAINSLESLELEAF